jgi:hypothetical protein
MEAILTFKITATTYDNTSDCHSLGDFSAFCQCPENFQSHTNLVAHKMRMSVHSAEQKVDNCGEGSN